MIKVLLVENESHLIIEKGVSKIRNCIFLWDILKKKECIFLWNGESIIIVLFIIVAIIIII